MADTKSLIILNRLSATSPTPLKLKEEMIKNILVRASTSKNPADKAFAKEVLEIAKQNNYKIPAEFSEETAEVEAARLEAEAKAKKEADAKAKEEADAKAKEDAKVEDVADKAGAKAEDIAEKVDAKAEDIAEKVDAKVEDIAETIDAKAEDIAEKVDAKVEDIAEKVDAKVEDIAEKVDAKAESEVAATPKENTLEEHKPTEIKTETITTHKEILEEDSNTHQQHVISTEDTVAKKIIEIQHEEYDFPIVDANGESFNSNLLATDNDSNSIPVDHGV